MGDSFQILPTQNSDGSPTNLTWYFMSIREKNKFVLAMGGEKMLLYKKRYEGIRCPLWDPIRHTSAQHSDRVCFGSGWISPTANMTGPDVGGPNYGFFAPLEFTASLISSAPDDLVLTDYGQQRVYRPARNWTLWEPLLTPGDLLVRRNNQRFFVTEVFPKRWKHYVLHQEWNMSEVERGSIVYELPSGL